MKSILRQKAKEIRKSLDVKNLSVKISENLKSLNEYKSAKNVCVYYSINDEVDTQIFINDKSKKLFLPKIQGDDLILCPYSSEKLVLNSYKIPEPDTEEEKNLSKIDLIIIPALAADKNGYRIGYGKGFYDRLLKKMPSSTVKITMVFSQLLFDDIHPDTYDERSSIIVTDKEIYRVKC